MWTVAVAPLKKNKLFKAKAGYFKVFSNQQK